MVTRMDVFQFFMKTVDVRQITAIVSGFPDGEVGAKSILFSEKVLESSSKGAWVKIENP